MKSLYESILSSNGAGIIFLKDDDIEFVNDKIINGLYTEKDIKRFDTSKVTDISSMFYNYSSLKELDLSGWDTSKLTDTRSMFSHCSSLKELDLSGWDTSKLISTKWMFNGCISLKELNLSGWNISNISTLINTEWMFNGCKSLKTIIMKQCDDKTVDVIKKQLKKDNIKAEIIR